MVPERSTERSSQQAGDEGRRLAALDACAMLGTPREPAFDSIVFTAAQLFRVPMARLTLVGEDSVWAKASVGRLPRESPRSEAICANVVELDQFLVVEDTMTDNRFADLPFVHGEPGVRFFAGVPIHGPGREPIGTLCVFDHIPRTVPERARTQLLQLAREAEDLIRLRLGTNY